MPYLEGILTNDDPNIKEVTNAMLLSESGAGPDEDNVHPAETTLLAASHVLKFSPTTGLSADTELSARRSAYTHRFERSKDPSAVAGFLLEDWCRAICLVLMSCHRRTGRVLIASKSGPQQKGLARVIYVLESEDTGYVDEEEAQTSTERACLADPRRPCMRRMRSSGPLPP
ncbi:hypothetical protein LY76DRAFT_676158 [Colletotrichum caudatum]|nr:hypothetical protein LY76DRAFT_676158 [Colletotrichum caudatum]